MPTSPFPPSADPGSLGENLVQAWLSAQGWTILSQRWRCRWGEIDLVAQTPVDPADSQDTYLVFVEVKTRRHNNWDAGGLLAITPQKQAKLWKTAQLFLSNHPQFLEIPCRFDVALVRCRPLPQPLHQQPAACNSHLSGGFPEVSVTLGQPVLVKNYQLTLVDYLESAFTFE